MKQAREISRKTSNHNDKRNRIELEANPCAWDVEIFHNLNENLQSGQLYAKTFLKGHDVKICRCFEQVLTCKSSECYT